MNEISVIDQILLRLCYVKFVSAALKEAERETKSAIDDLMKKGDTLSARSPLDDAKMARVNKSDPKPVATVSDAAALDTWIRETYPDKVKTETTVVGTAGEVIAVLREHAPHLLATNTVVPGWAINELVTRSAGAGEPVGFGGEMGDMAPPGIKVTTPDGVISVTIDKKTGPDAFKALWDAHLFDVDGTVLQQLPSGEKVA